MFVASTLDRTNTVVRYLDLQIKLIFSIFFFKRTTAIFAQTPRRIRNNHREFMRVSTLQRWKKVVWNKTFSRDLRTSFLTRNCPVGNDDVCVLIVAFPVLGVNVFRDRNIVFVSPFVSKRAFSRHPMTRLVGV